MHLWCTFILSQPTFAAPQLDAVQDVINELLPQWSKTYEARKGSPPREAVLVGRQRRLYDCVHSVAPVRRRRGSVDLTQADDSIAFYLDHFEGAYPPDANDITLELYERATVEDQPTAVWARRMFETVASALPVRYGNVHTKEEFAAKNMEITTQRTRALQPPIVHALPGLYWLNFFGPTYLRLIGRERVLGAPAYEVKALGQGVLASLDPSCNAWQSAEYRRREQAVLDHLGRQYFFDRDHPNRQTVGPDFEQE
jgi:hypothetical protein